MQKYEDSKLAYWIIGLVIVIVIGVLGTLIFKDVIWPKTNRELATSCTTDMATQFHIHPHLEIMVNGQKQEIPTGIGIDEAVCMHPLHTHDVSGIIHVESPEQRDFTLDDFFFIWNKKFSKDQILDYKADDKHVIKETINGKEVQDYENTILRDKDEIVISYEPIDSTQGKEKK